MRVRVEHKQDHQTLLNNHKHILHLTFLSASFTKVPAKLMKYCKLDTYLL